MSVSEYGCQCFIGTDEILMLLLLEKIFSIHVFAFPLNCLDLTGNKAWNSASSFWHPLQLVKQCSLFLSGSSLLQLLGEEMVDRFLFFHLLPWVPGFEKLLVGRVQYIVCSALEIYMQKILPDPLSLLSIHVVQQKLFFLANPQEWGHRKVAAAFSLQLALGISVWLECPFFWKWVHFCRNLLLFL